MAAKTHLTMSVLATMAANSSNDNLPSLSISLVTHTRLSQTHPSLSASMIVLSTICCSCWSCTSAHLRNRLLEPTRLEVVADHLFQDEVKLAITDVPISVHVVHFERDCGQVPPLHRDIVCSFHPGVGDSHRNFSSLPPFDENALRPPTNS